MKPYAPKPQSIPFTKEAYQKMETDLDFHTQNREKIVVRLQTAREMGDLSENGAYKYAKFELGNTDREIRRLTHLLRYGQVIKSQTTGIIGFGNVVTVKNKDKQITFTLVSKFEADPAEQKLSSESPLGQAVQGKKQGDQISVPTPSGETKYTISKVE